MTIDKKMPIISFCGLKLDGLIPYPFAMDLAGAFLMARQVDKRVFLIKVRLDSSRPVILESVEPYGVRFSLVQAQVLDQVQENDVASCQPPPMGADW